MPAYGRQVTLAAFGLTPTPLQTEPATYLHYNSVPETHQRLLFEPPIPTPVREAPPAYDPPGEQATLASWAEGRCPVCLQAEDNVPEHLLLDHADVINARLEELAAERPATPRPSPDADSLFPNADTGPDTDTDKDDISDTTWTADHGGQRLDNFNDPRRCNDCETQMSASYARTFASPTGDLWCPACRSRSQRYSNEDGQFGGTEPGALMGQNNPNATTWSLDGPTTTPETDDAPEST